MVSASDILIPDGYVLDSTSPVLPVKMNDGDTLNVYIHASTSGKGSSSGTGHAIVVNPDDFGAQEWQPETPPDSILDPIIDEPNNIDEPGDTEGPTAIDGKTNLPFIRIPFIVIPFVILLVLFIVYLFSSGNGKNGDDD